MQPTQSTNQQETKKTLRVFGFASFLNDFGSDMIYPIWPLFVTSILGANMTVLGLLDGLGDAMVSISQAVSGYLSDKYGKRKIFIWLGYGFGALSRVGYACSTTWQMLIPFRILDRAGKIRSAPRDAVIANLSTNEDRGKHFGFLRSMDNLGAVCGIVTCLLLLQHYSFTTLFLIAAIPSIFGVLLIFTRIKEQKATRISAYKGISFKHIDRNFILFLVLNAIFAIGSFSYSFLLLYAKEDGFQMAGLPLLYLVFTVIAAIFSMPFGALSDKFGRKQALMVSFLFWLLTCAGLLFFHSSIGIFLCFILYGLHKAALEPVQKALVSELAPPEFRASTLGGFQMVIGICAFPSSLIAGMLWQNMTPSAPLYLSILLTLIAILLLPLVRAKNENNM